VAATGKAADYGAAVRAAQQVYAHTAAEQKSVTPK